MKEHLTFDDEGFKKPISSFQKEEIDGNSLIDCWEHLEELKGFKGRRNLFYRKKLKYYKELLAKYGTKETRKNI